MFAAIRADRHKLRAKGRLVTALPTLHVYSRQGCHLCEVLIEELLPLIRGYMELDVRDVDSLEEWRQAYDIRIPVVEFEDEFVCQYTLDRAALRRIIDKIADSDALSG